MTSAFPGGQRAHMDSVRAHEKTFPYPWHLSAVPYPLRYTQIPWSDCTKSTLRLIQVCGMGANGMGTGRNKKSQPAAKDNWPRVD